MPESFFHRWARRKAEHAQSEPGADSADPIPTSGADAGDARAYAIEPSAGGRLGLPSMKDVALLATDADYSPFLARGVDKAVRRAAMKKLFSDPHFNVMDGLDIYIDDYTKPSPLPPGMLENLQHAKSTLEPKPLYKTQDKDKDKDDSEQDLVRQTEDGESDDPNKVNSTGNEPVHDVPEQGDDAEVEADLDVESVTAELHAGVQDTPINSTEFPPS